MTLSLLRNPYPYTPLHPVYRAFLTGPRGQIEHDRPIDAMNDEEALDRAGRLVEHLAVELWDRNRFIARIEPSVR